MRGFLRTWLVCCGFVLGCGDDDTSNAGNDAGGACPNLAGDWVVAEHCEAALVGSAVGVQQSGCALTTTGQFAGFRGSVGPNGEFDIEGDVGGQSIRCTGTATTSRVTQSCTGNCAVALERAP